MRFFTLFFGTILTTTFLWLLFIYFQLGNPTLISQWVYDAYQKKVKIAKRIKGKKILIVAGSNALFGINSKKLSKAFNLPVVNFGVNAGILLPYTLHKAKEVLNSGDIVLMPLEYSMYIYDGEANSQMIDYIFARDPSFLKELYPKELFNVLFKVSFDRILTGYKEYQNREVRAGIYGAFNIDNWGDQINTEVKSRSREMFNEVLNHKAETYAKEFKRDALSWKWLKSFLKWTKERDIKVILMPPTMMFQKEYQKEDFYKNLPQIAKKKGFIFIGEPLKYMYDKKFYFNTNYHLIDRARDFNTENIIKDLEKRGVF